MSFTVQLSIYPNHEHTGPSQALKGSADSHWPVWDRGKAHRLQGPGRSPLSLIGSCCRSAQAAWWGTGSACHSAVGKVGKGKVSPKELEATVLDWWLWRVCVWVHIWEQNTTETRKLPWQRAEVHFGPIRGVSAHRASVTFNLYHCVNSVTVFCSFMKAKRRHKCHWGLKKGSLLDTPSGGHQPSTVTYFTLFLT